MRVLAGATTALRRIVDVGLVILIVVVLLGVALAKVVSLTGRQTIVIGGGSMEPAIGLGAAVVIAPIDPATLAIGEVVSLRVGPDQTTFTHRIVAVVDRPDGRWIRTRGDANATPDPTLVPASAVLGRVELAIPFAGYLIALLSLPVGVLFVLGLAATLLAIAWLLESLDLEPQLGRRPESPDATPRVPSDVPRGAAGLEPGLPHGEPIAARRVPLIQGSGAGPSRAVATAFGSSDAAPGGASSRGGALSRGGRARPSSGPWPVTRPTVREQLERTRETRQRRARWLFGQERGRHAAE